MNPNSRGNSNAAKHMHNINYTVLMQFLRATADTAIARLSHRESVSSFVRLSVCLSVRRTGGSVKSDASQDYQVFTVGCLEDSSFRIRKVFP